MSISKNKSDILEYFDDLEYLDELEFLKKANYDSISSQIENSYLYLSEIKRELINEKVNILKKIEIGELSLSKLEVIIESMRREKDPNNIMFSPTFQTNLIDEKNMNDELNKLQQEAISNNNKLNILDNRISYINEVISCIMSLDHYNKSNINENNKKNSGFQNSINNESKILILENQEVDRKRIATELHDTTVQNLTSLVHKLELCTKLIDVDTIRVKLELQIVINTIRSTINGMRDIIFDLMPITFENIGLINMISNFVDRLNHNNDILFKLHVENDKIETVPIIELTIFRIIQEVCSNIIKHSKASIVNIRIGFLDQNIQFDIEDNGVGFDVNKSNSPDNNSSSFGLSIVKERVYLLSGIIEIKSEEGVGTKVSVKVPCNLLGGKYNVSN